MLDGECRWRLSGARGIAPRVLTVSPTEDAYRLRILKRCTVAGMRLRPGQVLWLNPDKLRVAAWLTANGCGRPNDERTALDVEVYRLTR